MKLIISTLLFLTLMVSLSTCTKDSYTTDVCFQEDVLPIFVSNCAMSGCHNATSKKEGYDFTNYEGIMKGVSAKHPLFSEVYNTIKGKNPSMPQSPYPKLSSKDVTIIRVWIKMGAPNSSGCSGCDTSNYKYSTRIQPLVQSWCQGCHNASSAGGGYDFSTYAGLASSISNGRLMGSLNHLSGFSAMPQNGGSLSQCDINAIQKWVDGGYPNN